MIRPQPLPPPPHDGTPASLVSDFDLILEGAHDEVATLARAARSLLHDVHPEVVEVVWPRQRSAGFGVGPKKYTEHYCHIIPYRNHVNLGFNYGRTLPDPGGLLQGTGRCIRHIRLDHLDQVDSPDLRTLVLQAVAERRRALSQARE